MKNFTYSIPEYILYWGWQQRGPDSISMAVIPFLGGLELILDFKEGFILGLRNDKENVGCH